MYTMLLVLKKLVIIVIYLWTVNITYCNYQTEKLTNLGIVRNVNQWARIMC